MEDQQIVLAKIMAIQETLGGQMDQIALRLSQSAAPRCLRAKPDLNWYPFPYKTRP